MTSPAPSHAKAAGRSPVLIQMSGRIHAGVAAEDVMSYNMPGFRILSEPGRGSVLLGYAGWQAHLALYPHSGTILSQMTDLTHGMSQTRGALHLPIGTLPSEQIVDRMITLRLEELS